MPYNCLLNNVQNSKDNSSPATKVRSTLLPRLSYDALTDLRDRIAEGQFYEAHQQLRTISARHTKAQNWNDAIEILFNGSLSLLKAGQGGSGGDLGLLLVDTMVKGEVSVTSESKG